MQSEPGMAAEALPTFPNYLQLRTRSRLPPRLWRWARRCSVLIALGLVATLFVAPRIGLFAFWQLIVPVLPLVFLVAPGLWRNACPLAALNQTPRHFNFTSGLSAPEWWRKSAYVVGFLSFFLLASSRKYLFNFNGPATGLLVLAVMTGAFVGGLIFKGKSGWCSSICPLYPLQRLYGQTPFATVANRYCDPCLGCTKNCYDFNPATAYLADLHDDDGDYASYRKLFAATLPGFILAFFTLPDGPAISLPLMAVQFALYMTLSADVFFVLDTLLAANTHKLTALYGAAAINLFYYFSLPPWLMAAGGLFGLTPPAWLAWPLQAGLLILTALWIRRTYAKEPLYAAHMEQQQEEARQAAEAAGTGKLEVTFMPDQVRVLAEPGRTILEVAESQHQPIEGGCRMGQCGADPVQIVSGMENLSAIGEDERGTLERLRLGDSARLACMCRIRGPVSVSLRPQPVRASATGLRGPAGDSSVRRVVIVGNGIAGVTAADYVRRHHADCEIHVISRERYPFYNRMAIGRLIYGRPVIGELYLQPDHWYQELDLTCWLSTEVTGLHRQEGQVTLSTGDVLPYDRLILTSGSSGRVPPIAGFGLPGTFVLHDADQALRIRAYVKTLRCRRAVIAGGGLLGLEAGYALQKLGLKVTILERGPYLLRRQLDRRGGHLLARHLEALDMHVLLQAEATAVEGGDRAAQVTLKDGRTMPCDLLLVAAGIRPNVELARAAGLRVNRGVIVDEGMRTNVAEIFAAGDVCEYRERVLGLWPVAVEQAKVAAINAVGGHEVYRDVIPSTGLKVGGVQLTSIGRFEPQTQADVVIAYEDTGNHRYRKLVISQGAIAGAILLGYPLDVPAVSGAIRRRADVSACLDSLRAGRWEVLHDLAA